MHPSSDGPEDPSEVGPEGRSEARPEDRSGPTKSPEAGGERAAAHPSGDGGATPPAGAGLGRIALVLGSSLFLVGMAWPGLVGRLPFSLLLKNQLHMPPQAVAMFWAVGTFAWYVKPLVGLVCDAVPLFGTRRRGYLLVASLASALAWATFAVVPRAYAPFVAVMTALNFGLVVITTVLGGMLVEEGQRHHATGRLNALHSGLDGAMSLIAGPLGGFLAVIAFGWTAGLGALLVGAIAPVTLLLYREPRAPRPARSVWTRSRAQLRVVFRSRSMGMAALLLFLVFLAPGFQTPLLYYQTDVLKFDARFLGILQLAGGLGMMGGAAVYAWLCRRLPLRLTLVAGIVLSATSPLLYLAYRSPLAALLIDSTAGVVTALATLPLMDFAARSTPAGSESLGFALLMSVRNFALFAVSDPIGSWLYGRFHLGFERLIFLNAVSSAAVLLFVPMLPAALLSRREGGERAERG